MSATQLEANPPNVEDGDLTRESNPLDASYYSLEPEETAFFKAYIGIEDDEELKQHIIKVQTDAYVVCPYPCIRLFAFAKLKISRFPAYKELLRLGRERPGALFLDLGCCCECFFAMVKIAGGSTFSNWLKVGNDVRKAVIDGYPAHQALASDLRPEFWQLGYELFKDTKETFPATFIPGNIFDNTFLPSDPSNVKTATQMPPLSTLTNLTPLLGRLSVIHVSSFFHLFSEAQQAQIARKVASLLSAEPGSVIFGAHAGGPEKGMRNEIPSSITCGYTMFCHSPESWVDLWEKKIFQEGQVRAWAILKEAPRPDLQHLPGVKFHWLVWSVMRL